MVLEDRHISYLILVRQGIVRLKRLKYVCTNKTDVDQTVAAQMKALGITRIESRPAGLFVALTDRGTSILVDEDEAWA